MDEDDDGWDLSCPTLWRGVILVGGFHILRPNTPNLVPNERAFRELGEGHKCLRFGYKPAEVHSYFGKEIRKGKKHAVWAAFTSLLISVRILSRDVFASFSICFLHLYD